MRILIADEPNASNDRLTPVFDRIRDRLPKDGAQNSKADAHLVTFSCGVEKVECQGKRGKYEHPDLDLEDQPELAATILDSMGQALLNRGFWSEAKGLLQRAYELRRKALGNDHPSIATSLINLGRLARNEGKLDFAEEQVRNALAINTRIFGEGSYPAALALNELARILLQQTKLEAAEKSALKGLKTLESLHLENNDPHVSRFLDTLARINQVRGNSSKAAEIYSRALTLNLKNLGETHPEYITHLTNLATVQQSQGHIAEAEKTYRKTLDIYRRKGLPEHPNSIDTQIILGGLLVTTRRYDEATKLLKEATELNRRVRGADHYLVGNDYISLAQLEFERPGGNKQEALQHTRSALRIFEAHEKEIAKSSNKLSPVHGFIAEALLWKARILLDMPASGLPEAEQDLRRAMSIWKTEPGPESYEFALAGAFLGRVLYLCNKANPEALRLLRSSYCQAINVRGADTNIAKLIKSWLDMADDGSVKDPCR